MRQGEKVLVTVDFGFRTPDGDCCQSVFGTVKESDGDLVKIGNMEFNVNSIKCAIHTNRCNLEKGYVGGSEHSVYNADELMVIFNNKKTEQQKVPAEFTINDE
jgi:hypothetical protein